MRYPEKSNLCLICDSEEICAIGLPDQQQKVTMFVLNSMLAPRWIEENVIKYRESKAPTVEANHTIDYSRRTELFSPSNGGESRLESNTIFFVVQCYANLLFVRLDKNSHGEASTRLLSIPGEDWTGSFKETAAYHLQWSNHWMEAGWQSIER